MVRKPLVLCSIAALALLMTGTAWADSVPITNASFETPGAGLSIACGTGCAYNYTAPVGWHVGGANGGSFSPGSFFSYVPDGSLVAYTNSGFISQTLTSSVLANTLYTLTVFVGNRTPSINGDFTLYLDTILNGATTHLCSVSGNAATIIPGTWQAESCTYQSLATVPAGDFYLDFVSTSGQLDVDDVSLVDSTTVPEPGSLLMLGLGMILAMGATLWRRRAELRFSA